VSPFTSLYKLLLDFIEDVRPFLMGFEASELGDDDVVAAQAIDG